ncbi:hypothetical protein [Funiculus sociatus]|uniref:hypothetical protein n=1 Tax=Funiculus sociatus TaxID=450527 RepID=UPI00329968A4
MVISSYLKLSPFISGTACEANRTNQVKRIFSSTKRARILPNTKRARILPNTKRDRILPKTTSAIASSKVIGKVAIADGRLTGLGESLIL